MALVLGLVVLLIIVCILFVVGASSDGGIEAVLGLVFLAFAGLVILACVALPLVMAWAIGYMVIHLVH